MSTTEIPTLRPDDEGYDAARLGFDVRAPQAPAVVVTARDAGDVVAAVRLAAAEGRRVAVQATGHGPGATDADAVLVDTSGLRGIEIDPGRRVARVEAGVRAGDLVAAAAEHGLAPLSGSHPGVGVVGYHLAGGFPLLGRAHGWAADRLRAIEVVTADGELRLVEYGDDGAPRAGAAVEPDADPAGAGAPVAAGADAGDDGLAWALRGGSGSFGIVTAIEVELIELRTVYGGQLVFDAERAPELLRAWRDWMADAPDALGAGISVAPIPDVDGPPPVLRGRTVVIVHVAYDGSAADGERAVAPLRAFGEPLLDGLRELPWTESASIHAEPDGPTSSVVANVATRDLDDAALDQALAGVLAPGADPRALAIRRMGGALARDGAAGPVRRDAGWLVGVVAIVPPPAVPAGIPGAVEFATGWRASVAPHAAGSLVGFLGVDAADPAFVESSYTPDAWTRLRAIKAAVDPHDRILAAAPVPPAA